MNYIIYSFLLLDEPPEVAFDDGATKLQEPTSTKEGQCLIKVVIYIY